MSKYNQPVIPQNAPINVPKRNANTAMSPSKLEEVLPVRS
jgi:hypothetical protein